jgi:hypothetical protein
MQHPTRCLALPGAATLALGIVDARQLTSIVVMLQSALAVTASSPIKACAQFAEQGAELTRSPFKTCGDVVRANNIRAD